MNPFDYAGASVLCWKRNGRVVTGLNWEMGLTTNGTLYPRCVVTE